ncbi:insulin-like growth factor-binding protein complex acid labile subunit [Periplaneta americana]|uniref:insulin-like growth factor-binding protein complex acid labile subunit n=1 Tax=Periplaneta americana TaxID=6978 RepID=UPI0037E73885
MGPVPVVGLTIALSAAVFGARLGCPEQCVCEYRSYEMWCNATTLVEFPQELVWCPEELAAIKNHVAVLRNGSFSPCGDTLLLLNLTSAGIHVIERGAFDDFYKLQNLDLRDNNITTIWESMFIGLVGIESIFLQNNLIDTVEVGTRSYDGGESYNGVLYLNNNRLKKLESGIPKGISVLYLDHNEIDEVTPDLAVFSLVSLRFISLKGNRIETLKRRAFVGFTDATWFQNEDSPLKNLEHIILDDNRLRDIEPFSFEGLPKVKGINISGNDLRVLNPNIFRALTSLKSLWIVGSGVEEMRPEAFRDLDALEELDLSRNRISFIHGEVFADLPILERLALGYNLISTVSGDMFSGLLELKLLNLTFNRITRLEKASFLGLDGLEVLDLTYNLIESTEPDAFCNLTGLDKLLLDHNRMTKVQPLSFRELPSLRELSLSHNRISSLSPQLDERLSILRTDLYLRGSTVEIPEPREKLSLRRLLVLDLSGNELQDLPPGVFRETARVFSLRLRNNSFRFLRAGALLGLRRVYELSLHDNPLQCDCALLGAYLYTSRNKIDTKLFEKTEPLCEAPALYAGQEWSVALEQVYESAACAPLQPLAAANQAGLFVVGPILLVVIGIVTYYFQKIVRKIVSRY